MKDKEKRRIIGGRAKQRRLELGVNQPYVAEKMGVTASTIQRYEAGMWRTQAVTWCRKNVQELLGHSDVSTTMNVYDEIIAHATREAKRESAKLLDKVVGMN